MKRLIEPLPPKLRPFAHAALSAVAGAAVAIVLNYILYRVGLPSSPFIYVAF